MAARSWGAGAPGPAAKAAGGAASARAVRARARASVLRAAIGVERACMWGFLVADVNAAGMQVSRTRKKKCYGFRGIFFWALGGAGYLGSITTQYPV
ncbi:hypothetical protein GCM10008164_07830 [Achromobacter xylosoxidans]|nr:hypothetical protein GCM10008164_07830 [Achromobacter xylosoxidans]